METELAPTLGEGDVVILDNLSSHTGARVRAVIEARKARLVFLPAYSPDLNPIEKMWAKIKEFLRAAKACTAEALEQAIREALATITTEDAQGWFDACGYAHTQ